jgi:microcystin-dependent protein
MNKINFTAKDNFPLSTETMEMMQQMIRLSAGMALLGGSNYILSGCVDDGTNVSDGIIVINGEMLRFEAGKKKAKITIHQTSDKLTAFGVEYPEAYVYRTAKFSDTGEYNWSDFARILTNQQLENKVSALTAESIGFIKMWAGRIDRKPDDHMLCNGDVLSTKDYKELAYSLGKDTEQNFALPDLRGRFIVGYRNDDASYDTIGKTGGEKEVRLTVAQMPSHSHNIPFVNEKWGDNANIRPFPNPDATSNYTAPTTSVGGDQAHENRPPYYVLAYVIKVK